VSHGSSTATTLESLENSVAVEPIGDLAETMVHRLRRDEMDRVEDRLRGGNKPDYTVNDARRSATAVRKRDGNGGGSVSETADSVERLRTAVRRAEPQRGHEGTMKRFFKSVFLTVYGDINEIG
jgi:hypothetical protein